MEGNATKHLYLKLSFSMYILLVVLFAVISKSSANPVIHCRAHPHGYKHKDAFSVPEHVRNVMLKEIELKEYESLTQSNIRDYFNVIKKIGTNEANHIQKKQCSGFRSFPRHSRSMLSTDPTAVKSLCPWAQDTGDFNSKRFPESIPRIKCICDKCIGVTERKTGCEEVYQDRIVLYAVRHNSGRYHCWEMGLARVPIGCTCAKQITL